MICKQHWQSSVSTIAEKRCLSFLTCIGDKAATKKVKIETLAAMVCLCADMGQRDHALDAMRDLVEEALHDANLQSLDVRG